MLFQIFIATFGLLMPLVLTTTVSEDNMILVKFTSHLKSRGLITAANTCPKSEICGVVSYTSNRSLDLVVGLCGALPEPESILSVYVVNCYCSFREYVIPSFILLFWMLTRVTRTCDSEHPKTNKAVGGQMLCQKPRMVDTFKAKPKYVSCGDSWKEIGLNAEVLLHL
jgi:hypothetical protein